LSLVALTGEESIPRVCENTTTGITTLRLIHDRTDVFVSFFGLNHMMTE
jgi:S-adenosylhomocysteine hydrolase